ncbi:MAG TPA: PSD1 and planctomycete cytochrome C domain-containing protein [Bryobacteraceae bacterium]|nr:PSD1 and planctomycete cytochrome C domain-containing protein [Bryobacteraceae bacterium]
MMLRSLALIIGLASVLAAQDIAERATRILQQNCAACHGAAMKMSGLDLRTRESMLKGGEHGAAVEPGNAEKSRLYRFVTGIEKPSMPPGKTLPADQIAILKQWIEEGAQFAGKVEVDAGAAISKMEDRPITPEERAYWAFRTPVKPAIPAVGAKNAIDAFLIAAMRAKGLKPSPKADRRTLIRRAYLDMTGLPPTPAQVEAFEADSSPDAFSKVVESLLASPHYGERWARHWLDLVRYADSGGFEFDRDRPQAWRYRDYVIRAFNEDKPYDRFVREQIAGDELYPDSADARIATGYLRLGPENNLKNEQTRLDELDDVVVTTSNAFLGVTVGCARCHNHKFDPIPQKDYYRMQAVFYPMKPYEYPLISAQEMERYEAEHKRVRDLQKPWKEKLNALEAPYRDRLMAEKKAKLPDYIQLALRTPPEQRTEGQKLNALQVEKTLTIEQEVLLAALSQADLATHKQLSAEIKALEDTRPKPFAAAMSVMEPGREAPASHFLHRGSAGQKGSVMQPGVLTVASRSEWKFPEPPTDSSTSWRRRGFAEWLASAENPLTARVMVNRIWQHHFGEGIVRTPSNFGKMGERPTHPELLDWLATEFMDRGWSIKAIHRLILSSETYQMVSDDNAEGLKADAENKYLWRMPRRRLEGEAIRDSIMFVAGNLDLTVGGPAVFPYIDPALFQSSSRRTWNGKPDSDPSTWRRSVYVFAKRSIPLPMLEVFDRPDSVISCARRNRSTIAPQALILMNNAFVLMEAQKFSERLRKEAGADSKRQVELAFALTLSRKPSGKEMDEALSFLRAGGEQSLLDFSQAMLNLNEFVYIQ